MPLMHLDRFSPASPKGLSGGAASEAVRLSLRLHASRRMADILRQKKRVATYL
jgi:hypothetical protein